MSREDLAQAYIGGQISRRIFVRRLLAAGVSVSAALAYAEMNPAEARATDDCDFYDKKKKDKKPKKPKKPKKGDH